MRARAALAATAALPLLAACDEQQTPTTVIVNTPPAGSGQLVLLTVMVAAAFLALLVAGGFAWMWAQERRAHRDAERAQREAEDAVIALTGQPIDRIRLELLRQPPTTTRAVNPDRHEIERRHR